MSKDAEAVVHAIEVTGVQICAEIRMLRTSITDQFKKHDTDLRCVIEKLDSRVAEFADSIKPVVDMFTVDRTAPAADRGDYGRPEQWSQTKPESESRGSEAAEPARSESAESTAAAADFLNSAGCPAPLYHDPTGREVRGGNTVAAGFTGLRARPDDSPDDTPYQPVVPSRYLPGSTVTVKRDPCFGFEPDPDPLD